MFLQSEKREHKNKTISIAKIIMLIPYNKSIRMYLKIVTFVTVPNRNSSYKSYHCAISVVELLISDEKQCNKKFLSNHLTLSHRVYEDVSLAPPPAHVDWASACLWVTACMKTSVWPRPQRT